MTKRVECPYSTREVAITPRGLVGMHNNGDAPGRCPASGVHLFAAMAQVSQLRAISDRQKL